MRIIHTADIHLRKVGDARWETLETILSVTRDNEASALVVSGDMFDRSFDAQGLKAALRDLFRGQEFSVFILPGNHDVRGLSDGDFFGDNVHVISDPTKYYDIENVRIFGFPFEKIVGERVLQRLFSMRHNLRNDGKNILLYHGELLDLVYSRGSFGEEEESGYMPARLSFFDDLGYDYVLAGHFHSNYAVQQFDGGYFVYPGSPVSITKKETGIRRVNLIEVGEPPQWINLDSEHYEEVVVSLDPLSDANPFERIKSEIDSCHPSAKVLLTISGFVDLKTLRLNESEFAAGVRSLLSPDVELVSERWEDIGLVLENDLYRRFASKLEGSGLPSDRKQAIRDTVIRSMMEAVHAD